MVGHHQYLFKEKRFKNGQVDMDAALKDKALWDGIGETKLKASYFAEQLMPLW